MTIEKVKIKFQESRGNLYHVPMNQWRKWDSQARQIFNEVYSSMNGNQRLFMHPKAAPQSRNHWKTTCWNAAWTAATAMKNAGQFVPLKQAA